MYMFKQLNFGLKAAQRDNRLSCGANQPDPIAQKKGADHHGRRPFSLDAINLSAYLLT